MQKFRTLYEILVTLGLQMRISTWFANSKFTLQINFAKIPFCENPTLRKLHFAKITLCENSILRRPHFAKIPLCEQSPPLIFLKKKKNSKILFIYFFCSIHPNFISHFSSHFCALLRNFCMTMKNLPRKVSLPPFIFTCN